MAAELWLGVRRLRLWTQTPPSGRKDLFDCHRRDWMRARRQQAQREAPEIVVALKRIAQLSCSAAVNETELVGACQLIATWAIERGFTETAIQYAEAAAILSAAAEHALLAGRLTRNAGDVGRAELWFARGIAAANRSRDEVAFIRGHLGYGILCMQVGREDCARKHFNTASVYAMQEGFEWLAAEAQHDLFRFMTIRQDLRTAELHARRALLWYPKHHLRLPYFAADVGFLLVCLGQYRAASVLLPKALALMATPTDSVLGMSVLVRALASAGQVAEAKRVTRHLKSLLAQDKACEAAALWNLAEAQRAAGFVDLARRNAQAALRRAQAEHDAETEAFAAELLRQVEANTPAIPQQPGEDSYLALAETLLSRLQEWSPNFRGGRSRSVTHPQWAA